MMLATLLYQRATTLGIGQVRGCDCACDDCDYICRDEGIESLEKSIDKRGGDIA